MGESCSDLTAVEFLAEHGYAPSDDENPFAVGAYVTGSKQKGIRNYGMNDEPAELLQRAGLRRLRHGLAARRRRDLERRQLRHPPGDDRQARRRHAAAQLACARGQRAADQCPGNRRWMQTVFDAYLLMADGEVSMLEARDAYLAADRMRFGGANQAEPWTAFARRGFGENAASPATKDGDDALHRHRQPGSGPELRVAAAQRRGHASPSRPSTSRATRSSASCSSATTRPTSRRSPTPTRRRPRARPSARPRASTPSSPGRTAAARQKFTRNVAAAAPSTSASRCRPTTPRRPTAPRSPATANPALADRRHRGVQLGRRDRAPNVEGATGDGQARRRALVSRVQVSALLRAVDEGDDQDDPATRTASPRCASSRSRPARAPAPTTATSTRIYTSPDDAFPGGVPRPLAPDMILRDFDVPDTRATHVRLVVLTNQCTGNADLQGRERGRPDLGLRLHGRRPATPAPRPARSAPPSCRSSRPAEVTSRPRPPPGGSPGSAAPVTLGHRPPRACASTAGFRSARPSRAGAPCGCASPAASTTPSRASSASPRAPGAREPAGEALPRKKRSFTYDAQRALGDGLYFARFRMPTRRAAATSAARALRVRNGRFGNRPAFYRRARRPADLLQALERRVRRPRASGWASPSACCAGPGVGVRHARRHPRGQALQGPHLQGRPGQAPAVGARRPARGATTRSA